MKKTVKYSCLFLLVVLAACGGAGEAQSETAPITLEMVDTPVDPVCRMNMTGLPIADTLTYKGRTYPLCNPKCKAQFEADPAAYVRAQGSEPESHEGHEHEPASGS